MNIDNTTYRSRLGFDSRVRFLVMHYTACDFAASIKALTGPKVSAHYLVPDPEDSTYQSAGFTGIRGFNLVDESKRAWHAGVSAWRGRNNLNDSSIGIEIVNEAGLDADGLLVFPPYSRAQIDAVKEIALDILQRYPGIEPRNVVGHSDIAPLRKSDPGPLFPWQEFYRAGIGAWYEEATKSRYMQEYSMAGVDPREFFQLLGRFGYDVSIATDVDAKRYLIRAFQLHYRPGKYDGVLDVETAAIAAALTERYC